MTACDRKRPFATKQAAHSEIARRHHIGIRDRLTVYPCGECGQYHISHARPSKVKRKGDPLARDIEAALASVGWKQ